MSSYRDKIKMGESMSSILVLHTAGVTEVFFLLNSPTPLGMYTLCTGFLCSRVNSHSSPTLCCHDRCTFPLIVLVALNCTYTNMSMSFLYIVSLQPDTALQMWTGYHPQAVANALYEGHQDAISFLCQKDMNSITARLK